MYTHRDGPAEKDSEIVRVQFGYGQKHKAWVTHPNPHTIHTSIHRVWIKRWVCDPRAWITQLPVPPQQQLLQQQQQQLLLLLPLRLAGDCGLIELVEKVPSQLGRNEGHGRPCASIPPVFHGCGHNSVDEVLNVRWRQVNLGGEVW